MIDTVQHYLCNYPLPAMPVDGDKPHEAAPASAEPIYWRCNRVTLSQRNGFADYRCLDGSTIEVHDGEDWRRSRKRSVFSLDSCRDRSRCNADGTPLAQPLTQAPDTRETSGVAEPLKVDDWIEILQDGANCADVKRDDVLMVDRIDGDGSFRIAGRLGWWFQLRDEGINFCRVPPPSEQVESDTCGIGSRLPSGACDHCNQPIVDDTSPPACKSCGVPWRDHLGPESQCAELNDRIVALDKERDELQQQLASAQAEAAAMWEALDKCRIELVWIMRKTKSRKGGSVDKAHAAAFAALGSTAGRELLEEMNRKDGRIAELEGDLAFVGDLLGIYRGNRRWKIFASPREYGTFRDALDYVLRNRDLFMAERKTLAEQCAAKDEEIKRLISERDGFATGVESSARAYADLAIKSEKDQAKLHSQLSDAEAKAAKLDELRKVLRENTNTTGGRLVYNPPASKTVDGLNEILISIRDGGAA